MHKKTGQERIKDYLRISKRAKDMDLYFNNWIFKEKKNGTYDFAKATQYDAMHYLFSGIGIVGIGMVIFLLGRYTSLIGVILVFLVIAGIGILYILAGIRVWRHVKRRRK